MKWTEEDIENVCRLEKEGLSQRQIAKEINRPLGSVKTILRNRKEKVNRVLVIPDLHAPFVKEGSLQFCVDMYKKHKCNKVVFIGDILDNHYSSFHDTDPDGMGAGEELQKALAVIREFGKHFPVANVCTGNHDSIGARRAFNAGLSKAWIRSVGEIIGIKGWQFSEEWVIDKVLYTHGTGRKAKQRCMQEFTSVVQGHYHSETYYETFVSAEKLMFAMQLGCLIDRKSYAMAYGKNFRKPQINVGIVVDNGRWGFIEHMPM